MRFSDGAMCKDDFVFGNACSEFQAIDVLCEDAQHFVLLAEEAHEEVCWCWFDGGGGGREDFAEVVERLWVLVEGRKVEKRYWRFKVVFRLDLGEDARWRTEIRDAC